jgi:hypothetical protein
VSLSKEQRAVLFAVLDVREHELDCDEYLARLPAEVDVRLHDEATRALMAHHRKVCPECREEYFILRRALGLPESTD